MLFSITGAKLYIGGVMDEPDEDMVESDFASQTWVHISETENLGNLGDIPREMEFNDISRGRIIRVKGTRTATIMELICGLNVKCPGQLALIQAETTNYNYGFRLVFADAPPNGTPSERLFIARVGNIVEAYETGDEVVKFAAPLWVNSNLVRINAAEPD